LPHLLGAWNRLRESADADSAIRLELLLTKRGIDQRALTMLKSRSMRQRLAAITAVGHLRDRRAWERLEVLAAHPDPVISFAAARAAAHRREPRTRRASIAIPARSDWPLARLASVFHELGPGTVTNVLITMLLRRPRPDSIAW
jgi:hypothetical protein